MFLNLKITTNTIQNSFNFYAIYLFVHLLQNLMPGATSIGRIVNGGVVVWTGKLASGGHPLCSVDLISHSSGLKPARM